MPKARLELAGLPCRFLFGTRRFAVRVGALFMTRRKHPIGAATDFCGAEVIWCLKALGVEISGLV